LCVTALNGSLFFDAQKNKTICGYLEKFLCNKNWEKLLRGMQQGVEKAQQHISIEQINIEPSKKRKRPLGDEIFQAWERFSIKLESVKATHLVGYCFHL
jgi:hypothetical protein